MSGITLTAATRQNLLSLQGTADLLTTTQNRLSTGKKVNSALDDPTSFFTSQALSGRSGDLGQLLNGISNGVQTIQAANQGITSIQKLVDSAKSTANQALADKSVASTGKAAAAATVIANTSFQGTSTANKVGGVPTGTQDFSISGDASFSISLDGGTTSTTIKLDRSTLSSVSSDLTNVTADNIATVINNQISNNGSLSGKVSASVDASGKLALTTAAAGAAAKLQISTVGGTTTDIGFGVATGATASAIPTTGVSAIADVIDFSPVKASVTGSIDITTAAGTDISVAKTVKFNVVDKDGNSTSVSLNKDSTTDGATKFADASKVTKDELLSAINYQLKDSSFTAALDATGKNLQIQAKTAGAAGTFSVNGVVSDTDVGFGTTASTNTGTVVKGADSGSASFTVNDGATTKTITIDNKSLYDGKNALGNSATKQNVLSAIQAALKSSNLAVSASLVGGKVTFASTNFGADSPTIEFTNKASVGGVDIGYGTSAAAKVDSSTSAGVNGATTVFGASSGSDAVNGGTVNTTRQSLAKQFNELRNQITQQAKDASYNGINLLYRSGTDPAENTLKVTFNETGSSSLNIAGTKLDSDGLGLTAVTGDFQSDDEINKALTAITQATSQLRAQASTFGSNLSIVQNRQDFSKNLINILDTGAANLTNADLNEEAANSQALSTRQSIGISALSLANTAQQGILQLLR